MTARQLAAADPRRAHRRRPAAWAQALVRAAAGFAGRPDRRRRSHRQRAYALGKDAGELAGVAARRTVTQRPGRGARAGRGRHRFLAAPHATAANSPRAAAARKPIAHRHHRLRAGARRREFDAAARDIALLVAPNTSLGGHAAHRAGAVPRPARCPRRVRHRDHRGASPQQARCAVRDRARPGRAAAAGARSTSQAASAPNGDAASRGRSASRTRGDIVGRAHRALRRRRGGAAHSRTGPTTGASSPTAR